MLTDLLQAAAKLSAAGEAVTGVTFGVVPVATLADGSIFLTTLQVLLDPATLVCKRCTLSEAVDLALKQEPPEPEGSEGSADSDSDESDEGWED